GRLAARRGGGKARRRFSTRSAVHLPMTTLNSRRPAFWTWAILIVVANFVLIGAVVLPGYLRDVVPTSITPADRATAGSTRLTIAVRYPTTMDSASLRAAFRLDPAVPGSVDVNGRELTFRPSQALQPDANYTITLRAGLRDVGGRAAHEDVRATFHTRSSRL